jgi:uncharacterized protein YndB with AHSA1/START domain
MNTQNIVVEDTVPHSPDIIWKALTIGELMGRWLMPASGFEAVEGNRFTNHCQCRDCQHKSGTGHGSYLTFPDRRAVTLTGQTTKWDMAATAAMCKRAVSVRLLVHRSS